MAIATLGEFEQSVLLAIAHLATTTYGVTIRREIRAARAPPDRDRRPVYSARSARAQGLRLIEHVGPDARARRGARSATISSARPAPARFARVARGSPGCGRACPIRCEDGRDGPGDWARRASPSSSRAAPSASPTATRSSAISSRSSRIAGSPRQPRRVALVLASDRCLRAAEPAPPLHGPRHRTASANHGVRHVCAPFRTSRSLCVSCAGGRCRHGRRPLDGRRHFRWPQSCSALLDAAVLRPLPVRRSRGRSSFCLAKAGPTVRATTFSYPDFEDFRANRRVLADLIASGGASVSVRTDAGAVPRQRRVGHSPATFQNWVWSSAPGASLGAARPCAGGRPARRCRSSEIAVAADRRCGHAVRTTARVVVNGQPFTIVGVADRSFHGIQIGRNTRLWAAGAAAGRAGSGWRSALLGSTDHELAHGTGTAKARHHNGSRPRADLNRIEAGFGDGCGAR
jgi:hypothetical protein